MDNNQFQNEVKNIMFDIYADMQKIDVSSTLHRTKKRIDNLLTESNMDIGKSKILKEVTNLCFKLWAPLCENVLSTYQEIQNLLIPRLETLLDNQSNTELQKLLVEKKVEKIDFTKMSQLPSMPIMKHIWTEEEVNIPELDLGDDKDFDLHIEDFQDDFDEIPEKEEFNYEDGPYCRACQQAPCMCSDPEKTSTTLPFGF